MADETKNETVSDLADLKDIAGNAPEGDAAQIAETAQVPLREQELDKEGRAYATGRRKDATARVWLKPGSGKVIINGKDQEVYFARPTLRLIIDQPPKLLSLPELPEFPNLTLRGPMMIFPT